MSWKHKLTATVCGLALLGALGGLSIYQAFSPHSHNYISATEQDQFHSNQAPDQQQADQIIGPVKGNLPLHWNADQSVYTVGDGDTGTSDLNANVTSAPYAQNTPHTQDPQGRATLGNALINQTTYQPENRNQTGNGEDRNWQPKGWAQQRTSSGWLYNRGHLLAYSLVGNIKGFNASESNPDNVVTETQWANTVAQAHYELQLVHAINSGQTIRYQVQALYSQDELVPRAIHFQAKSRDNTVNINVLIPNAQAGYNINYANGSTTSAGQNNNNNQPQSQSSQAPVPSSMKSTPPTPNLPDTGRSHGGLIPIIHHGLQTIQQGLIHRNGSF